jgi:hypothetical protein
MHFQHVPAFKKGFNVQQQQRKKKKKNVHDLMIIATT